MSDDALDMAQSELRSLVTKAARGAGASWGLAEEAGWATEWLARRGLPAAQWAETWLADTEAGRPDPVGVGAILADRLTTQTVVLHPESLPEDLSAPGYLLPFLHLIAARHGTVAVLGPFGSVVQVTGDGTVVFGPAWSDRTRSWRLCLAQPTDCTSRAAIPRTAAENLGRLALRITVPPSEVSRRNAGAATSDND